MGLFDRIFGRAPRPKVEHAFEGFTAYRPQFKTWGGQIYESELVRSAIDARARNISKLQVRATGTAKPALQNRLKMGPNEFQTWGQFLYRLSTILDMQNTAFIVPIFGQYGEITGVFPVLPSRCEIIESGGYLWLRYEFANRDKAAVELHYCGVMTRFQYQSDFFGEDNKALIPTMELINMQQQGINEGIKSAATFRFMAKSSNFIKPEDLTRERDRFVSENFKGEGSGGLLLFPNTYSDVRQIDSKPFVVDAAQMEQIQTSVYNYFGVNKDILQNSAYGDKWSAFYEGAIEPFAVQLADVMTRMLFTAQERQRGSEVVVTANRLQYLSNADKLNVSAQMADRGLMTINEIREIWNLPPIPGGDVRPARGEYYMLDPNGNETGSEEENND